MHFDYIIVGQGIAGSLLSYRLIKAGAKVLVTDNGEKGASYVAAGMFNPVAGRKLTPSWNAELYLKVLDELYSEIEAELQEKFYFPLPIIKLFSADANIEIIRRHAEDNGASKYIKHFFDALYMQGLKSGAGACEITGCGYINTTVFLSAYRQYLSNKNALSGSEFNYNDVKIEAGAVKWNNISAGKIIFCEGYKAVYNPYFNWLPFNVSKGDVFTIYAPELKLDVIVNKGAYIVPLENGYYRVGSTYKWQTLNAEPDTAGFAEMKADLDKIIDAPYEIIKHEAGIRPTVKQRRPFLGLHPEYRQLAIFNGLGTKAVMIAPELSRQMTELLLFNKAVDPDAGITRYPFIRHEKNA